MTTLRRARRPLRAAGRVGLAVVGLALATPLLMPLAGFRMMVVQSGSMAPTLLPGDAIVARAVSPDAVRVGDVVTFRDPSREGMLLTHRVVEQSRDADGYTFATRGDANTGEERWSIAEKGKLGRLAARAPGIGRALRPLTGLAGASAAISVALALVAAAVLRKIWLA
jgi:signal peptidase